jgi:hypothetical protein
VAIVPAKGADVKVGLAVFAVVGAMPAGGPTAPVVSLIVEKNGVKPVY